MYCYKTRETIRRMEDILANHCEQNFIANIPKLREMFAGVYREVIGTMDNNKIRRIGMNKVAEMCFQKLMTEFQPEIRIYPNKSITDTLNNIRGPCSIYFNDIDEVDVFCLTEYVKKMNDNGMVDAILEQVYDDRSTKSNAWHLIIKYKPLKALHDITL